MRQGVFDGGEVFFVTCNKRRIFLRRQRFDQFEDLLRAIQIALEVPQVGVAVAILFTGDLGRGDLFHQRRSATHDFLRR